jgi:hypothetical protein
MVCLRPRRGLVTPYVSTCCCKACSTRRREVFSPEGARFYSPGRSAAQARDLGTELRVQAPSGRDNLAIATGACTRVVTLSRPDRACTDSLGALNPGLRKTSALGFRISPFQGLNAATRQSVTIDRQAQPALRDYWEFTKMRLSQRPLKRQVREAIVVVVVGIAIVVTLVVVLKRVQVKLEAPPANPAAAR